MALDRTRELAKSDLEGLPETRVWPSGARLVYSRACGTWEGWGYDGFKMSAGLDRYFVGPQGFEEVVAWYKKHLAGLGWPHGTPVDSANRTRWHAWRWDLESIQLIDRVIEPDAAIAIVPPEWREPRLASELPLGSWMWSVTYEREPPPGAERSAALTPPTDDEMFDETFWLLEKFVAREGHADVPLDHVEEGVHIGVWVSNLRFEQANLDICETSVSRLQALPGWRWLSGSDFFLLERYARREGNTRMPEDFMEEGRPLGRWVAELRRMHASHSLAKDEEARLLRIPGWEW